jgi:DNA polymerase-3 subunit epsilon
MRQIILDTETTGLSAETGDRIIEVGCVELVGRKFTGNNRHLYINPERKSHEEALKVHGISDEFLRDKPKFAAVADELIDYLRGAEIIIHNAPFDVGFLNKEFELCGKEPLQRIAGNIVDSLAMAKEMFPGKRNSLDALCNRLDVDNSGRTLHGALLDAELLADVYINMTRGQEALLMDSSDEDADVKVLQVERIDLRQFVLPVLLAGAEEEESHRAMLKGLDKFSGGKTVWTQVEKNPMAQ